MLHDHHAIMRVDFPCSSKLNHQNSLHHSSIVYCPGRIHSYRKLFSSRSFTLIAHVSRNSYLPPPSHAMYALPCRLALASSFPQYACTHTLSMPPPLLRIADQRVRCIGPQRRAESPHHRARDLGDTVVSLRSRLCWCLWIRADGARVRTCPPYMRAYWWHSWFFCAWPPKRPRSAVGPSADLGSGAGAFVAGLVGVDICRE